VITQGRIDIWRICLSNLKSLLIRLHIHSYSKDAAYPCLFGLSKGFWQVIQLFQMSVAVDQRRFVRFGLHFKQILDERFVTRELRPGWTGCAPPHPPPLPPGERELMVNLRGGGGSFRRVVGGGLHIVAPAQNPSINVFYVFETFMLKLEASFIRTLA
jgi:hypothetical protein